MLVCQSFKIPLTMVPDSLLPHQRLILALLVKPQGQAPQAGLYSKVLYTLVPGHSEMEQVGSYSFIVLECPGQAARREKINTSAKEL